MEFTSPFSRIEAILQNILGADNVLEDPLSRAEVILLAILNDTEITEEFNYDELSELEALLYAIKESDEEYDTIPETRSGKILLKILHGEKYEGETVSRVEELLKEWSHAAAWYTKTVGPSNPISVTDALAEPAVGLKVDLSPIQASTPWIDTEANTTPYLLRPTETTGNTADEKLVGGSVVWNQLVNESTAFSLSNATGSTVDGICTFTASAQNGIAYKSVSGASFVNHVLFGTISYKTTIATNDVDTRIFSTTVPGTATTNWQTTYLIAKATTSSTKSIGVRDKRESDWDAIQTKDVMICDLTQMFANNPAIADYAYTLEQAEVGSGIAWLKAHGFFNKIYYPYNPGEIMSTKAFSKKVVGLNKEQTYELGNDELRGLFELNTTTNKLYADGDVKTSDGVINRKMVSKTLNGTEDWIKVSNGDNSYFRTIIGDYNSVIFKRIISDKYETASITTSTSDIGIGVSNSSTVNQAILSIRPADASSITVTQFKALLEENPVHCYYGLTTPTTESSTPFTNPQDVYAGGTEEFVDSRDVPIPVGHETIYSNVQEIIGYDEITITHGTDESDPNPTIYTVSFQNQGTVYSGSLDVLSGVLTVDMAEVNLGTLNWLIGENSSLFYTTLNGMKYGEANVIFSGKCSKYPSTFSYDNNTSALNNMPDKTISNRTGTTRRLFIKDSTYTDAATFKSEMDGVQLVYELATPITYNLTQLEVEMLLNSNYLKSDGGVMTLTYKGTNPAILLMNKLRTNALMRKSKELQNGNLQPVLPTPSGKL